MNISAEAAKSTRYLQLSGYLPLIAFRPGLNRKWSRCEYVTFSPPFGWLMDLEGGGGFPFCDWGAVFL
jgi:hypothetical protein